MNSYNAIMDIVEGTAFSHVYIFQTHYLLYSVTVLLNKSYRIVWQQHLFIAWKIAWRMRNLERAG